MRALKSLLVDDHGLDLAGWILQFARGISDDGRTIVGYGINPLGQTEAWLARLPAPNSAPVVTCPTPSASFECECGSTPDSSPGAHTTLTATVTDTDGDLLTVIWEVDGVEVQRTGNVASGTSVSLEHVYPLGSSVVTVTVEDCSVSDTCSTTVTVVDTIAPVVVCQPGLTVSTDPGECVATGVVLPPPTVSENCQVVSLTNDAPAAFPLGDTVVTWTATDIGGNTATCQQVVTVEDNEPPTLVCPPDVVVGHDLDSGFATNVALGQATEVSDNCGVVSLTNTAPASFPLGETEVSWIATDPSGSSASCVQTVTVVDDEAPVLQCPPGLTIPHDANACVATNIALGAAAASDNCGVSLTNNAPAEFVLGETIVTWTATDAAGNSASCDQTVTVTNQAPAAGAGSDIGADCTSPAGAVVTLDGGASSDPEGDTLEFLWSAEGIGFDDDASAAPTATFPIGSTRVTLTVTDVCGEVASANVMVVVYDAVAPVIQMTDASHDMLWPPNHELVPVTLRIIVSDDCAAPQDLAVACTATSDEPDDSSGDGAFTGDVNRQDGHAAPVPVTMAYNASTGYWEGTVLLRAERKGDGDGRKYSFRCAVSDTANTTTATLCIVVPHSKGGSGKKK